MTPEGVQDGIREGGQEAREGGQDDTRRVVRMTPGGSVQETIRVNVGRMPSGES